MGDEEQALFHQQIAVIGPLQNSRAAARAGVKFHQLAGVGYQNRRARDQGLGDHGAEGLCRSRRESPGQASRCAHLKATSGCLKGSHPATPEDDTAFADADEMIEYSLAPQAVDRLAKQRVGHGPPWLAGLQVQANQIRAVERCRQQEILAQDRRHIAPD